MLSSQPRPRCTVPYPAFQVKVRAKCLFDCTYGGLSGGEGDNEITLRHHAVYQMHYILEGIATDEVVLTGRVEVQAVVRSRCRS